MDKIELQRLLDGELDHEQRRRALVRLDEQPSQWRMVALALLEEQAFDRELNSVSQRQSDSTVKLSESNVGVNARRFEAKPGGSSKVRWLPMALAACLLVGLGVTGGNWLASRFDGGSRSDSNGVGPSIAIAESKEKDPEGLDVAQLKAVGHLSFASDVTSNASDDSVHLPVYEAAPEQLNQILVTQQHQMRQWNDQLRRRGLELDWRPEMLESRLPDGRSVIVPIQQVHVRNIGQ